MYLEAALRTLRGYLPRRPPADINLPCEAIYADDTDFISTDHEFHEQSQRDRASCTGRVVPVCQYRQNRVQKHHT